MLILPVAREHRHPSGAGQGPLGFVYNRTRVVVAFIRKSSGVGIDDIKLHDAIDFSLLVQIDQIALDGFRLTVNIRYRERLSIGIKRGLILHPIYPDKNHMFL